MKGGRFGNLRFRVLGGLVLLGCCLGLLSGGAGAAQAAGSAARHARLFSLERVGAVQVLRNALPWGGATEERAWVLVPSGASVPSSLAKLPRISVPAKRVVALTIPAVSALSLLGCPDRIVGVGGKRFLYDPAGVRGAAEVGPEGGMGPDVDLERIVALKPDLVLAYVYTPQERAAAERLTSLGVPVVFLSEYLEETPLGMAEWLVAVGALVDREARARDLFDRTVGAYGEIRARARGAKTRPRVMAGSSFQGTWYVAGRDSWLARLVEDAGGTYLWEDLPGRGSVPVDGERVFVQAERAEAWVQCGLWRTLEEIRRSDPRLARLRPLREKRVFNNDARSRPGGGNDVYESGVWRPDRILGDLGSVLHPERFPGHRFFYYRRLPEGTR